MERDSITDEREADLAFQRAMLQGVSRTFALTIPTLPPRLAEVVGNAYLLCRLADTIEDEPALDAGRKREFSERLVQVVEGREMAAGLAADLHPLLGAGTLDSERRLVRGAERVVRVTHGFSATERDALARCVRIMSGGMSEFQQHATLAGLRDIEVLDRYCYHVAGVVGEMLTTLFCEYSPSIAAHRARLAELAVSFGQALQMTNILKDMWEDRRRGACWLPREVFARHGVDLASLGGPGEPGFAAALDELIAITRTHLANALEYTLLLPAREIGVRRFCLWALGMAVLTLRRIHRRPDFAAAGEVKISRASVRATVAVTNAAVGHDLLLRWLFAGFTQGLPRSSAARTVAAH